MTNLSTSARGLFKSAAVAGSIALTVAGASLASTEPAQAFGHDGHYAFHHGGGFRHGGFGHYGFGHRGFGYGGYHRGFGYHGFGHRFGHYGYGFRHRYYGYGYRRLGFVRPLLFGRPCLHRVFTPYGVRFRRFC